MHLTLILFELSLKDSLKVIVNKNNKSSFSLKDSNKNLIYLIYFYIKNIN